MSVADDLASKLVADGVGTLGVDLFVGSAAVIPAGMGPYLALSETGGVAPTRVQNRATAATQRPTVQVVVIAGRMAGVQDAWTAARAKSKAAYSSLDGLFNATLNGVFYLSVTARQEPTDMGIDATGTRVQVVFNVQAEKQLA